MKRLHAVFSAGIAMLAAGVIVGCASMTPAQIASALCVPTETAVSVIEQTAALNPNNATAQAGAAALEKVKPVITAACTAASTITSLNVQALITQGLPAIGTILGSLPLPAATISAIEGDFQLAEAAVNLVDIVVTNIKSAQTVSAVMAPNRPTLKAPPLPQRLNAAVLK